METKIYISVEEDSARLVVNGPLHLLHKLVFAFRENLVPPVLPSDVLQEEISQLIPPKKTA